MASHFGTVFLQAGLTAPTIGLAPDPSRPGSAAPLQDPASHDDDRFWIGNYRGGPAARALTNDEEMQPT